MTPSSGKEASLFERDVEPRCLDDALGGIAVVHAHDIRNDDIGQVTDLDGCEGARRDRRTGRRKLRHDESVPRVSDRELDRLHGHVQTEVDQGVPRIVACNAHDVGHLRNCDGRRRARRRRRLRRRGRGLRCRRRQSGGPTSETVVGGRGTVDQRGGRGPDRRPARPLSGTGLCPEPPSLRRLGLAYPPAAAEPRSARARWDRVTAHTRRRLGQ